MITDRKKITSPNIFFHPENLNINERRIENIMETINIKIVKLLEIIAIMKNSQNQNVPYDR